MVPQEVDYHGGLLDYLEFLLDYLARHEAGYQCDLLENPVPN